MIYTTEQEDIIRSKGNIRVNAIAGSGKTSTVVAFSKNKEKDKKILYIVFNKSAKDEAKAKFNKEGLDNVVVETAHSLAFKKVLVRGSIYKISNAGYKPSEIISLLGITASAEDEKYTKYVLASHVSKFAAYFCNSKANKVNELNYAELITNPSARELVDKYYNQISFWTRLFLAKMDRAEIDITHDFYLKKFQLSNPILNFDIILFDEGQDASPVMLDIFTKQNAVKVIVGDTHQQIYGWRYAVNALSAFNYDDYYLSESFRFGPEIAELATSVLNMKKCFNKDFHIKIKGSGKSAKNGNKAIIARGNLSLLKRAISYVTQEGHGKPIYFEGNIHSYTYAADGTSLYDVLHLYKGRRNRIKNKFFHTMRNFSDLEKYVDKTEDVEMKTIIEIVTEYGDEITDILEKIKNQHTFEKQDAELIFSTAHKSKGMEYCEVELTPDFITQSSIDDMIKSKGRAFDAVKVAEEINILYVAVTRAISVLKIPSELVPSGYICDGKSVIILKENIDY